MKDKDTELRILSFRMDNEFKIQEDLGNYGVFGKQSKFIYKAHIESKQEANQYVTEITKNKVDHKNFMNSL